jgi:hypothetical protein
MAINLNSLRKGNIVAFTGGEKPRPVIVCEIRENNILVKDYTVGPWNLLCLSRNVDYVALTDKLLETLGFEPPYPGGRWHRLKFFAIAINPNDVSLELWNLAFQVPQNFFLHSLQNLYFSLTGEELPVDKIQCEGI